MWELSTPSRFLTYIFAGFVENHRPLELDCITGEGEGGEADDVGAIYLPTTPGPERIRRKSLSDLTDLATTQQDGLGSPPTQTGNVKEIVASPDGSFRDAVQGAVEPDVDHVKVRIHPGLIVNVIENVLNFDKDEDEGECSVVTARTTTKRSKLRQRGAKRRVSRCL